MQQRHQRKAPAPIAQSWRNTSRPGVSRIDSACAEEICSHGLVLATAGLFRDHAIWLGLEDTTSHLFDLELSAAWWVLAPLRDRGLCDAKSVSQRFLATEVVECLICSHAVIL
jgi:hypothetical protein